MLLLLMQNLDMAWGDGSVTPPPASGAHQGGTMGRLGGMMVRS
jgi:hypothetical protein